ncbi:hypothetical protein [Halorhabdus salina]|nr:hypothetical protein [Halorhabdus salina]
MTRSEQVGFSANEGDVTARSPENKGVVAVAGDQMTTESDTL